VHPVSVLSILLDPDVHYACTLGFNYIWTVLFAIRQDPRFLLGLDDCVLLCPTSVLRVLFAGRLQIIHLSSQIYQRVFLYAGNYGCIYIGTLSSDACSNGTYILVGIDSTLDFPSVLFLSTAILLCNVSLLGYHHYLVHLQCYDFHPCCRYCLVHNFHLHICFY
jgi:hypothetical protein